MRFALLLHFLLACSASGPSLVSRNAQVTAAPPPKDDGKASKGGNGGDPHAAALEQLKTAQLVARTDKQDSVRIPLPDGEHWTRVRFWGQESLVAFRYGKDHHAVVGGYVTHVKDNQEPGACRKSFEKWAKPLADGFDVDFSYETPKASAWNGNIVELSPVVARTKTLLMQDSYFVAYASYPVWGRSACLALGVAVPTREEADRARAVRDRFLEDVLPKVEIVAKEEPKERY